MGRWAQYRKRGRAGEVASSPSAPPPVFEEQWNADNNGGDPGILRFLNLWTAGPLFWLNFRYRITGGDPDAWTVFVANPLNPGDINSDSGLDPVDWDVEAAFADSDGNLLSAWSAPVTVNVV